MLSDIEILRNHRKTIKMNHSTVSYLDKSSSKISVIIPTYNRCPHPLKEGSNPLGWCLESLLAQKGREIGEIVIVDDASRDYTQEIVENFSERLSVPIVYIRNQKNIGSSLSRNKGVEKSKSDLIMFLDDDAIFLSEDAVFTVAYSFKRIEKEEHDVGAMHLPVYYRTNRFGDILSIKEILNIDYENSHIRCSTGSFPKERAELKQEDYFKGINIMKPLEVNNLAGVFLCKKRAFLDVGGFSDFFPTPALGEEHELAQRLTNKNYKIFFNPEPRSAVLHFRYGRKEDRFVPPFVQIYDNTVQFSLPLEKMLEESNTIREDTGNAVSVGKAMYSYVFGRMMIFSANDMSRSGFIERVKEEIIRDNRYAYSNKKINSQALREKICLNAIGNAEIKWATLHTIPATKQVLDKKRELIYQVGVL